MDTDQFNVNVEQVVQDERRRPGFWRRQFGSTATGAQSTFDILLGVLAPVLCYVFDPAIFKGSPILGAAFLEDYQLFAYSVSAIEVLALVGWLLLGRRFGNSSR